YLRPLLGPGKPVFGAMLRMSGLGVLGMNYLFAAALEAEAVVLPEVSIATARELWALTERAGVNLLYLVPAQLELVLRLAGTPSTPRSGMVCITGSAPVRAELHRRLQESSSMTILNAYGLTEVAFAAFFGRTTDDGRGALDIGRPVTVEARLR